MSYAEPNPWSDVYVWRDGERLHCEAEGRKYTCETEREMYQHLRMHVRKGDKVPDKALERLWHEMNGLPYETDIERVLRALRTSRGDD